MQNRVMKFYEHKDDGSSYWRVACDCSDSNHDAHLYFEVDEYGFINTTMYYETGFYDSYYPEFGGIVRTLWNRLCAATKILFTGRYTMTGDVILNEDGTKAMRVVLDEALKQHKQFRKDQLKKNDQSS